MFIELTDDEEYRKTYFDMLKSRLTYGSLEVENETGELASARQAMKIFAQYEAINYVFSYNMEQPLSHYQFLSYVCSIASKLSSGEVENFRTTTAEVVGSSVQRSRPELIRNNLIYVIDDYNYQINEYKKMVKDGLDNKRIIDDQILFKIEAQFHIRFLHVHPFDDYNGRTARIMLTRNLCEFNKAPCILTKDNKKEYCKYIEKNDVCGLANFFEKLSDNELMTMVELYKSLNPAFGKHDQEAPYVKMLK